MRPHRRTTQIRRNLVVLAWIITALGLLLSQTLGLTRSWGPWLPLHALMLGGIGSAITIWSAHFADTLLHRPAWGGAMLLDARLYLHSLGAVAVLYGITSGRGTWALVGLSIIVAAAIAGVAAIIVQYRRAVAPRLAALAIHYACALALLAVGACFGYLTSRADASGDVSAADRFYIAHTLTMLLGFVGTTVLGTLTVLWPTMLRTKMMIYAPCWTTRALPALVLGTAVSAAGGFHPALTALGAFVYLLGALGVLLPAYQVARRVPPTSFATASAAAAVLWFLVAVLAVGWGGLRASDPSALRATIHAVRLVLATGFALQILLAALSYLTPVMLGGGPATTRATNTLMERAGAYRVSTANLCLAVALWPGMPTRIAQTCAALAIIVTVYTLIAMVRSFLFLRARLRHKNDDVVATSLSIGPPPPAAGTLRIRPTGPAATSITAATAPATSVDTPSEGTR